MEILDPRREKGKLGRGSRVAFSSGGFTLVELLVVSSLLLLLSALALVNLREAQTRAKVARVKADFRLLASALERYQADCGTYPVAAVGDIQIDSPLVALTTPCAYLGSCPIDPFGPAAYDFAPELEASGYQYLDSVSTSIGMPGETYRQIWQDLPEKKYMLHSSGPNCRWDVTPYVEYDPTNGSNSNGDICEFGPG